MAKPTQRKKQQNQQQQQQQKPVEKKTPVESSKTKVTELNPKTNHYEFGGPIGAIGMVVLLPVLVLFFATCCDSTGYPSKEFRDDWKSALLSKLSIDFVKSLWDPTAFMVYVGFVAALAIFYVVLPGDNIPGTVLRNGEKYKYRMNGKAPLQGCQLNILIESFLRFRIFPHYHFYCSLFFEEHWIKTPRICL